MNIEPHYRALLHTRVHPLGGASSLHAYWNDVEKADRVQPGFSVDKFNEIFARLSVKENEPGMPLFSISILHGAAQSLPDPLEYFKKNNGELPVKVVTLRSSSKV